MSSALSNAPNSMPTDLSLGLFVDDLGKMLPKWNSFDSLCQTLEDTNGFLDAIMRPTGTSQNIEKTS